VRGLRVRYTVELCIQERVLSEVSR
jgi:hypothetical protein